MGTGVTRERNHGGYHYPKLELPSRVAMLLRIATAALLVAIAGISSAAAFSYGATTVSYDSKARGAGTGSLVRVGDKKATLKSSLKDLKKDGMRTYTEARVTSTRDVMVIAIKIQSGRRGDGKKDWYEVKNRSGTTSRSIKGTTASVRVYMDRKLRFDPCKVSKYGTL